MKFNVNQQDLQQALNYCQGVIEKRSTLPILSNILIDANNSNLIITATDLDLIFIESGGDNLSATFSPELADITVYMIDVAMGSDIPRKRGPAMMKSDILLVNKTDLAPHVDVDLASMERDLKVAREDRPYFLIQAKNNLNIEKVSHEIVDLAGL